MKVLLTGGTGFIGKHLVSHFVHTGVEVVVLSRDIKKAKSRLPANVTCYAWPDPLKTLAPQEAFDNVQVVINLAGESLIECRWTKEQKKRIHDSRVGTTASLIKSLEAYKVKTLETFISSSAIGYYPSGTEDVLDEASQAGSFFVSEVCTAWEDTVMHASLSVRKVIFRWGVVLGYEAGLLRQVVDLFDKRLAFIIGSGQQLINWISITDTVEVVAQAIQDTRYQGIYNGVSPYPTSYSDFVNTLAAHLGRRVRLRIPSSFMRIALGERAHLILDTQNIRPKALLERGFRYRHPRFEAALKDLLP